MVILLAMACSVDRVEPPYIGRSGDSHFGSDVLSSSDSHQPDGANNSEQSTGVELSDSGVEPTDPTDLLGLWEADGAAPTSTAEVALSDRINQQLTDWTLPSFELIDELSWMARQHSKQMALGELALGHDGFEQRFALANQVGTFTDGAENVAYDSIELGLLEQRYLSGELGSLSEPSSRMALHSLFSQPLEETIFSWLESDSHRRNLLNGYNYAGIGISLVVDCEVQVGPREAKGTSSVVSEVADELWQQELLGYWGEVVCESESSHPAGRVFFTHFMLHGEY